MLEEGHWGRNPLAQKGHYEYDGGAQLAPEIHCNEAELGKLPYFFREQFPSLHLPLK